ncbi:MAG: hypothetical protein ACFCU3_04950 [Verrucomicrobiales bacterium]
MLKGISLVSSGLFWVAALGYAQVPAETGTTTTAVASETIEKSRRTAFVFAGALQNQGLRLREGFWSIQTEPGLVKQLPMVLLGGNVYVLLAVAAHPEVQLSLRLRDGEGQEVATATSQIEAGYARVAMPFEPKSTDTYTLELQQLEGGVSAATILVIFK